MVTRKTQTRVPEELEAAARQAHPDLADESLSVLVRAGLAMLAGLAVGDAIRKARSRGGASPIPRDFQPVKDD